MNVFAHNMKAALLRRIEDQKRLVASTERRLEIERGQLDTLWDLQSDLDKEFKAEEARFAQGKVTTAGKRVEPDLRGAPGEQ